MNCRVSADLRDLASREAASEVNTLIRDQRVAELVSEFETNADGDWMAEVWPYEVSAASEFVAQIERLVFQGDRDTALIDIKTLFEAKHKSAAERIAERE